MQDGELASVTRAEGALGLLQGEQRIHADELVSLGRQLFLTDKAAAPEQRARIGYLVEILARREAAAMPYAAFGRALLAHVSGAEAQKKALLQEFSAKLDLLGM